MTMPPRVCNGVIRDRVSFQADLNASYMESLRNFSETAYLAALGVQIHRVRPLPPGVTVNQEIANTGHRNTMQMEMNSTAVGAQAWKLEALFHVVGHGDHHNFRPR